VSRSLVAGASWLTARARYDIAGISLPVLLGTTADPGDVTADLLHIVTPRGSALCGRGLIDVIVDDDEPSNSICRECAVVALRRPDLAEARVSGTSGAFRTI
jgi:hypothetical protein